MASEANTATLSTNLAVTPYYDDFNESKNFHRILFRPGLAVQARELTQMQSILQNQIDRFAEHVFKEGSVVRGCEVNIDSNYNYVKLRNNNSTGSSINATAFLNKTVKGTTSGVRALIINTNTGSEANTPNFNTFFVKYTAANTSGTRYFANNEILSATDNSGLTANTIASAAIGKGCAVTVGSGVVFAKDHFVRVPQQTLILDKYTANSSYRVGFDIEESIIKEADDSTLLDPASGSYNYAAPGAARLKIVATLAKKSLSVTAANNFVELFQIKNGILQSISDKPQYSEIRDYIAQRTSDESGDYVVRGFGVTLHEHLKSANNQGILTSGNGGNSSLLVVKIEPGKAYVQGYDIEKIVSNQIAIEKGIDVESVDQVQTLADYGNYVIVDNVVGKWDLDSQTTVSLRNQQANAISTKNYSLTNFPATSIGSARVRGLQYYSGTPGTPSGQFKLYLTDIRMNAGYSFANTQSICFSAGSGFANGKADIVGSNGKNANTLDPSYDRLVFQLPVRATKRLRNSSGVINNQFEFYREFDISFDNAASAVASISSGSASETFTGSGALSSAAIKDRFYVVAKGSANTSTLTGTVSVTSGSNTVTGSGTSFTTQVNAGDLIRISNTGTTQYVVSEVTSATSLKLLSTVSATKTGMPFWKVFKQGQVLNLAGVGRDGARAVNITSTTTATLDLNETFNSPTSLDATLLVKMNKLDGQEVAKTVNRNRLVQIRTGNTASLGSGSYAGNTTGPWPLGLSDGFKLVSVRKKTGSNFSSTSEGTDVTNDFELDTGMKDSFYDHAKLRKKSTSGLSIGSTDRLLVTVDYFTHSYTSGSGYISVDSYPVDDATAGSDTSKIYTYQIPIYTSDRDGARLNLRDCIDLRPRITDTANSVTTLTNISINPLTSTSVVASMTNGLHMMTPQSSFTVDLQYYLPRKDRVNMTKEGSFEIVRGNPSLNPRTPMPSADRISLAELSIAPYPSLPQEIARRAGRIDLSNGIIPIKNERFTMRDIGVIRDRVDRLEYYTSLSLLERDAKDLPIKDSNGNDRFKNGILVDSFIGHNIGNVYDRDYKISIDTKKGEARPPFALNNIELFYNSANSSNVVRTNYTTGGVSKDQTILIANSQAAFSNGESLTSGAYTATLRYKVANKLYIEGASGNFAAAATVTGGSSGASATISSTSTTTPGDLVTLPYSHSILIDQPHASTTRNCSGLMYNWAGVLTLDPPTDYWSDTVQRPDVAVNFNLTNDNWVNMQNAWQTDWGNWQTVWTGTINTGSTREVSQGQSVVGNQILETFAIQTQTQTTTTQARTGITSSLTPVTRTQTTGQLVKDVNIQPFMRSRVIRFAAQGMKPSTKVYPFFDGVSVSSYVTPTNSSYANTANEGGSLTTDTTGKIYGLFRIPADQSLRFRTGDKNFRLTDNSTNAQGLGQVTTAAEATYSAEGLIAGVQNTTFATRSSELSQTSSTDTRTTVTNGWSTTGTITRVVGTVAPIQFATVSANPEGWAGAAGGGAGDDPVGQTFLVNSITSHKIFGSGVYVSKIDLWFSSKDSSLPVIVEIRETDTSSGLITSRVVPFGRAIVPASDVNTSSNATAPTPIYFPSPVYLEQNKEYAFVVIPGGGNPNYRVFTAVLGQNDIGTDNRITSQPAVGTLFASSNDRVWSPVQEEDMKFRIYAALFDKTVTGTLVMKNENRDYMVVSNQSAALQTVGETVHGETLLRGTFSNTQQLFASNGSTYIQGMVSGATGILIRYASSSNLHVKSVSTTAKFKGGEAVRIRLQSASGKIVGNSTGGLTSATTPTGRVVYYDAVSYSNTYLHLANTSYINSGAAATQNRMFTPNMWIKGQTNGYTARIVTLSNIKADLINLQADTIVPGNTSLSTTMKMATSTSARDTTAIQINLNDDTEFGASRYILSRSNESNTYSSSSTMGAYRSGEFVFTLESTSNLASPVVDLRRIGLITVENLISSNSQIGTSENGVKSGGNSKTKYISRKVTLADGQDAEDLKVYVTAYKPSTAQVFVYYKALHREDSDTFNDAKWIPMTQNTSSGFTSNSEYSSSENTEDFIELTYDAPTYNNTYTSGANNTNGGIVEYRNSSKARFVGFKYFAIKIVMTKDSSVKPPRLRDFRVIALQR